MIGIYKIQSPSGGVYIGKSLNIDDRWRKHKKYTERGNSRLKNSLLKYGAAAHLFEVIHELPTDVSAEVLNAYEIYYISQYRSVGINLLNITDGGNGGVTRAGHKNSEKQKNAARESGKKRKLNPEQAKKMLEARLKKYPPLGIKPDKPSDRKEWGRRISEGIKSKMTPDRKRELIKICLELSIKNVGKTGAKSKKSKIIEQYTKDGVLVAVYHGVREASRITGIDRKTMYISCNDNSRTAGGFKWKYSTNNPLKKQHEKIRTYA